jgi:hypothetical protein
MFVHLWDFWCNCWDYCTLYIVGTAPLGKVPGLLRNNKKNLFTGPDLDRRAIKGIHVFIFRSLVNGGIWQIIKVVPITADH